MPLPVRIRTHLVDTVSMDLGLALRTKSIPPKPNSFVADVNNTVVQEVFAFSK